MRRHRLINFLKKIFKEETSVKDEVCVIYSVQIKDSDFIKIKDSVYEAISLGLNLKHRIKDTYYNHDKIPGYKLIATEINFSNYGEDLMTHIQRNRHKINLNLKVLKLECSVMIREE